MVPHKMGWREYKSTEFKSPRIMPLRRVVQGRPTRRNVDPQDQGVPNTPEVQPQGKLTNVEFRDIIRMLSRVVTNQASQ
ncbi:hypothetical protein H5410_046856 [Solanum commersonii]|uniref:Gag-pol polyprotein n=1 Tax=Solanum commersonii TaxID=4109 RepID=A0A9J5XGY0_SOLCO|nr:hypothetical protein H5410_046856 [Solanum commersonii]